MARIRTIKPEFWQDEKLAPLPAIDRLVFLGLISQADDAGRLVDNSRLLDGLLFPMSDETSANSLDTLARLGRISRYTTASGQRLIQIVNWTEHQKVAHPSTYTLPAPVVVEGSHENGVRVSRDAHAPIPDPRSPTYDPQKNSDANASGAGAPQSFPQREPSKAADITDGELMQLVRKRFYAPDGKPPTNWAEGREFTIFRDLRKLNHTGVEIADAIEGAASIRDDAGRVGDSLVDWLKPGDKMTMRALYNTKNGIMPLWSLAHQKLAETQKRARPGRQKTDEDKLFEEVMASIDEIYS